MATRAQYKSLNATYEIFIFISIKMASSATTIHIHKLLVKTNSRQIFLRSRWEKLIFDEADVWQATFPKLAKHSPSVSFVLRKWNCVFLWWYDCHVAKTSATDKSQTGGQTPITAVPFAERLLKLSSQMSLKMKLFTFLSTRERLSQDEC